MAGRPTKLTKEVHDTIVDSIELGVTYKNAVGAAGISYQTFLTWLEKGESVRDGTLKKTKTNKTYLEFLESVEQAKHKAFSEYTKTIHKAAKEGDWRAAESFLKRRDPENWGDRQKIDHNVKNMDDDELREFIKSRTRNNSSSDS